jgi:hypothetical protein
MESGREARLEPLLKLAVVLNVRDDRRRGENERLTGVRREDDVIFRDLEWTPIDARRQSISRLDPLKLGLR